MIDTISACVLLSMLLALTGLVFMKLSGRNGCTVRYPPPCFPSLPVVGSLPFINGGMDVLPEYFLEKSKRLGPVFSFYAQRDYVVVINGKKTIFEAFLKKAEIYSDRSGMWTEINLHNKEKRGITFSRYDENFRKNHKLVLSILKEFGFGVSHESDVRVWQEANALIQKLRSYDSRPIDPKEDLVDATAKVFLKIIFGESPLTYIRKLTHNASKCIQNYDPVISLAPMIRFLPHYRKKLNSLNEAIDGLMSGLNEAIAHIKSNQSTENSFTKRFLEIQGPDYDHQDLVYILRDLCAGSSDTMSVALMWTLVEMANRKEVRTRIQKEIDENVPLDRFPSYNNKRGLPYTEAFMLECSRVHLLAPLGVHHGTLKDSELCGYFIPKGSIIVPNLLSVHQDPEIWKDPENFRPERFLDENINIVGKENVLSFSIGKRSCIGEMLARHEVFVFFCCLMQHFDVLPPEGLDYVTYDKQCYVTIAPANFKIRFVPRKSI